MVLDHALQCMVARNEAEMPPPLRLLLLGTAGTGKTRAIQTLLQRLHDFLKEAGKPATFVKVAAPTGTAAFNIRFNATTIHRLIRYLKPPYFRKLTGDKELADFQAKLQHARLALIDEISMVGRQMMGRIATRFEEAAPLSDARQQEHDLGGFSAVAVGDPAQCEAMGDQQIYDTTPHKDTLEQSPHAMLSNRGLKVYAGFDEVVF